MSGTLVGGSSLITIPVLIFLGLPPHSAIATDRMGVTGIGISRGDFSIFFTRPISLTLLIITATILATSCRKALLGTLREETKEAQV